MGRSKRQKEKSSKLKHRRRRDSTSSDSSSEDEWVEKVISQKIEYNLKETKRKHGKRSSSASSNSTSSEDEWVKQTSKRDRKPKKFHKRRNSSSSSFSEDNSSDEEAEKAYKRNKNKQNKSKYDKRRNNNSSSSDDSEIDAKPKYKNRKNKYEKRRNDSSSSSSGSEAKRTDKNNKYKIMKNKYDKRRRDSSTSSSSSEDAWTEKRVTSKTESAFRSVSGEVKNKEEDWLSFATSLSTASHVDRRQGRNEARQKEKESQKYDPRSNVRELNPYWKSGGDGLPSLSAKRKFAKPVDDDDDYYSASRRTSNWRKPSSGGYKKPEHKPNYNREVREPRDIENKQKLPTRVSPEKEKSTVTSASDEQDLELNEIAAKLIKAEILGNTDLVKKLKEKLEIARQNKNTSKENENKVMLVKTDSKGLTIPLKQPKESSRPSKRKADTHESSGRSKYYADDDEPSLKEMFESAKFSSTSMDEKDFMETVMRTKKGGDFDDVFVDKIRNSKNAESAHKKMRDSAVAEYQKDSRVLENCNRCIQNEIMVKNLMISMGDAVYLTLPSHEPLTENHCLLVPIRHITCSTQLDENEWEELMNFRKAITQMFAADGQDVIFYETMYSNSRSHMYISCVPVPKESGDLAPIYFKKAIEECETEWSVNKKLINLAGKDIRKAVPKGLPYFFVSFGMNEGFAHIIEDKRDFPKYFASEVIGGILDIPHTIWRYPKEQEFKKQQMRVLNFSKVWSEYDCTRNK